MNPPVISSTSSVSTTKSKTPSISPLVLFVVFHDGGAMLTLAVFLPSTSGFTRLLKLPNCSLLTLIILFEYILIVQLLYYTCIHTPLYTLIYLNQRFTWRLSQNVVWDHVTSRGGHEVLYCFTGFRYVITKFSYYCVTHGAHVIFISLHYYV